MSAVFFPSNCVWREQIGQLGLARAFLCPASHDIFQINPVGIESSSAGSPVSKPTYRQWLIKNYVTLHVSNKLLE